jgi:tetratricopeptide (TPR) repeat protein
VAATDAEMEAGAYDEKIIRLSELAVPLIGGIPVEFGATANPRSCETSPLSAYFAEVPSRIAAGQALHQAMWEEKQGRAEAALSLYGAAVEKAPQDPGVLSACGNFFFRRGDMERATFLLSGAIERVPDSAWMLNCLGSALGQMGRNDEALACFERALRADPLDGISYYNLALALHPYNRHGEIIAQLEAALRDAPHFPDGPLWLHRIREKFPR